MINLDFLKKLSLIKYGQSITDDFKCVCGRKMGRLTYTEGDKAVRICGWCAERKSHRLAVVRREIFCAGCNNVLLGWTDFKSSISTYEAEIRSQYLCKACKYSNTYRLKQCRQLLHPIAAMSYVQHGPSLWFGDGSDGSLTLGSDTTLAAGDNIKRYSTLNLGGHILDNNGASPADYGIIVYVRDSLTSSGGKILSDTLGGGGTAGASVHGSGAGAKGGGGSGFVNVYARRITGSGTIGGGIAGNNGGNGGISDDPNWDGGPPGGAANTSPPRTYMDIGNNSDPQAQAGSGGTFDGSTPGGGTGQAITNDLNDLMTRSKDYLRWLNVTGGFDIGHGGFAGPSDIRFNTSTGGAGGGAGASTTLNVFAGGGGGGGGGSHIGAGGKGGDGGHGAAPGFSANSTGGGAGGGGGAASVATLITGSVSPSASWAVSADGGKGGNGGMSQGVAGGGGAPGGGGGGSVAIGVFPRGFPVTVSAKGGKAGTAGSGSGTAPTAGVDGGDGFAHTVAY